MPPNPYPDDPDVVLFLEFQEGNQASFETLMKKYYKRILNFIHRFIGDHAGAQDLTQEVFLSVYHSAASYRPQAKFQTWIFKIARNASLNALRGFKKNTVSLDETLETQDSSLTRQVEDMSVLGAQQEILDAEKFQIIEEAILSLPENQRTVILLRRYDEFSYEEIAETMNCSVEAVKSLLSRARANLKIHLSGYLKEDK